MIKQNQSLLNRLNILTDGAIVILSLLMAVFVRFSFLDGVLSIPMESYMWVAVWCVPVYLISYQFFGLYGSFRSQRLYAELAKLLYANVINTTLLLVALFLLKFTHFSRLVLVLFFILVTVLLGAKRVLLRKILHHYRRQGYNLKHVILVGSDTMALQYQQQVRNNRELGYKITGYVAEKNNRSGERHLGNYGDLLTLLEKKQCDEVVITLAMEEYHRLNEVLSCCEKVGVKVSIIPFYAHYFPSNSQVEFIGDIPLLNMRSIPLDNLGYAMVKRLMDIVGALVLIVLSSPLMLAAVIGVKLSSPGEIIFKQERVGKDKKKFYMYKFRSMRINDGSETAWTTDEDPRKTKFGAFIRKYSIDELPQFFNVLKGEMSLVGPRPEIPHFVSQFKENIPLYMLKHQVRPGITGWAQVSGLRGDTSIEERIRHDIFYIEHWSIFFDLKILFMTLFKGIVNSEKKVPSGGKNEK